MFALYISRRPRHYFTGFVAAAACLRPWLAALVTPVLLLALFVFVSS